MSQHAPQRDRRHPGRPLALTGPQVLVVTGPQARAMLNVGNTKFFELVKAGKIKRAKLPNRFTYDSVEELARPQSESTA